MGAAAAAISVAAAAPASAHPHIFIDNTVTFLFEGDRIAGIHQHWVFDDVFSDQMLSDFDADGDGTFSAAESAAVAAETLPNMAEFRYFNYEWVDGKDLGKIEPSEFVALVENKLVAFAFVAKLPQPVDPRTQKLKVEINDREYYIEVDLAKENPVRFKGAEGIACRPVIRDDVENAYYGGFVYPQEITLKCE